MASPITIYPARTIITMNPVNPEATHVAVRDGRILGAGPLEELQAWGAATIDDRFRDKVIVPGLIEAHAHLLEGAAWAFPYVGYFDRVGPDGRRWPGCLGIEALLTRLRELDTAMTDPAGMLFAWGLDPIYFPGERLSTRELDQVSKTRPILILHASGHVMSANSALLKKEGITRETQVAGVVKRANGEPTGELQEMAAVSLAREGVRLLVERFHDPAAIWDYAAMAHNAGCTTLAEIATEGLNDPATMESWSRVVHDERFPVRMVLHAMMAVGGPQEVVDGMCRLVTGLQQRENSAKLRIGGIKIVLDGSIQGFTARMKWPVYYNGAPNGIWNLPPEQIPGLVRAAHRAGICIQAHCNGEETIDAFIDAVEAALRDHAWLDHRHCVQHSQLTTSAQYSKMARLGMCANIFANHLWYWGDQHFELTVGPERARGMEACATAKREGVRFSLHSDANVTPIGQLHSMWCAVNRVTPKGRVLGEREKISAYDALKAVTLDAAWLLRMEDETGSIECGKFADFTVLEENPLEVEAMKIRDIRIAGTVLGGIPFPVKSGAAR